MKICLFGAGSKNIDEEYLKIGYELGSKIAKHDHSLVFGGGNDGMMGSVANGVKDNGGQITAIVPEWMGEFEDLFTDYDTIIYTLSMDERKQKFISSSDSFLIVPGGIGTLDEFFEVLTLKKLKKHDMDIVIFNMNHFFDKMLDMLNSMMEEGFVDRDINELFVVTYSIDETVNAFIH